MHPWRDPDPDVIRFGETLLTVGSRWVHDTGCGAGRHSRALCALGLHVIASDIDRAALKSLRIEADRTPFTLFPVAASMFASPLPAASLDGILAFNVIYHTRCAGMKTAMDEARRTLKPGGLMYLTLATPEHGSCGRGAEVEPHTFLPASGMLHHFSDRHEAEALTAGFQVAQWGESVLDYVTQAGETIRCVHWRIVVKKDEG